MNITTTTALFLAKPIIVKISNEIFASVITEKNLLAIKLKLVDAVKDITGKTSFVWDDNLVDAIIDKMADPEFYQKYGDKIIDALEDWVQATETKWDDLLLMPVFSLVRVTCNIPDND